MATLAVTALPNRQENCPASSRGGGCRWVTVSDYRGFYNQEDGQNNLHVVERVGKLGRWRNHKNNFKELGSNLQGWILWSTACGMSNAPNSILTVSSESITTPDVVGPLCLNCNLLWNWMLTTFLTILFSLSNNNAHYLEDLGMGFIFRPDSAYWTRCLLLAQVLCLCFKLFFCIVSF